jgi:hypothetical protein
MITVQCDVDGCASSTEAKLEFGNLHLPAEWCVLVVSIPGERYGNLQGPPQMRQYFICAVHELPRLRKDPSAEPAPVSPLTQAEIDALAKENEGAIY